MSWRKWLKDPRPVAVEPRRDIPYEMPGQRLGPQLGSEISHLFDDAQIPNFAWDWIERSPIGETRNHLEFEFVVPGHLVNEAHKKLVTVGFRPCDAGRECHIFEEFPFKPEPTIHFHHIKRVDEMICLRRLSSLAAKVHLTLNRPEPDDPDFMLTNDSRLGGSPTIFAPLPDRMYPLKLLTPVRFTESLLLQFVYDVDSERESVIRGYLLRLAYMKKHGEGPNGFLSENDFHEYLRPVWGALEEGSFHYLVAHARRVKFQLNKTGFRLPTAEEIENKRRKRMKQARKEMENN